MSKEIHLTDELISDKIYFIRNQKVMLDRDLASLYGIETRVLKQAVRRNISRFPEDFMFELNKSEFENWRSQFVTSNSEKMGLRYLPMVFTEHGVLMLSIVLNNDKAIQTNIQNYADIFKSASNAFRHHRFKNRYSSNAKKIRKS